MLVQNDLKSVEIWQITSQIYILLWTAADMQFSIFFTKYDNVHTFEAL